MVAFGTCSPRCVAASRLERCRLPSQNYVRERRPETRVGACLPTCLVPSLPCGPRASHVVRMVSRSDTSGGWKLSTRCGWRPLLSVKKRRRRKKECGLRKWTLFTVKAFRSHCLYLAKKMAALYYKVVLFVIRTTCLLLQMNSYEQFLRKSFFVIKNKMIVIERK